MQTIDSSKAAENVTGSDGAIHIPSNPTLAGLASLTRNVAYKTGISSPRNPPAMTITAATPP